MEPIRIAISGPTGRMGRRILERAREDERFRVVAALVRPEQAEEGAEIGGVPLRADLPADCDLLIEFTNPTATLAHLEACLEVGCGIVVGTTGFEPNGRQTIERAAEEIPVVWAPNTSLGIAVLTDLVQAAARSLGPDYDIEIVESHHRMKVDAPSGTALHLGEAAARGRGVELAEVEVHGRHGAAPRTEGEIGFHAVRGGGIVGEHTVYLAGATERIELTHRAVSRSCFAHGALEAAAFLAGKDPGLYGMKDVLM